MNTNIISDINVALYHQADLQRQARHDALARQAHHSATLKVQVGRMIASVGRRMQGV